MCKENQEEFSKNLWALYAPDVTAAQGLPTAPSGRRQAVRRARELRRDRAPGQAGRPPRLPAKARRPRRGLAGCGASGRLGGRRKQPPARQTASARTEPASAPAKTRPVRRGGCRPDSPSAQAAPAPAPARRLPRPPRRSARQAISYKAENFPPEAADRAAARQARGTPPARPEAAETAA